jgi:hypothetical protein
LRTVVGVTDMARRIYVDRVQYEHAQPVQGKPAKKRVAKRRVPERPQFALPFPEAKAETKRGRVVYLRVVQEQCGTFDGARNDVPATRAECEGAQRPCPHVKCRHHLWLTLGSDRAGRRGHGELPGSELEARWLDAEPQPSCALDVAEATAKRGEPMSIAAIGAAMGRDDSTVWLLLESALKKLRDRGVEVGELLGET